MPSIVHDTRLLDIFFERMPMGIATFDRDLRLQRCNRIWAEYIGQYTSTPAEQVVPGASLFDLAPGSEESLGPILERVLAGESIHQEALLAESKGIVSYWDVAFIPLRENKEVVGVLDVTTDATSRVLAHQRLEQTTATLREREERLSLVMQGTNDGIWDWDLHTDQVYYSPRWRSMLGYGAYEIEDTFEGWRRLVHPADLPRALATIRDHLEGRASWFELEHRLRHKDGSYRWILARGAMVRDSNGQPYRMVGSHTDITDRRLAEEARVESEAHLRSLLENATDFAVYRLAVDPQDLHLAQVVLVSPSITDIVGISDPYHFESWFEGLHPDDRDRVIAANERALREAERYDQVARFRNQRSRQWVWVHTVSTPVFDEEGNLTHFNGLVIDITKQRRAEEALQQQVAFENLITGFSTRFINLNLDEIDQAINQALRDIGEFTRVDRSYVFMFSGDRVTFSCTHEWCAPGVAPQIDALQDLLVEEWSWSNDQILRGEVLHVPCVADLPSEAEKERDEFQQQDIQSLVAVPMIYRGETIGFLGFDAVRSRKTWSEHTIAMLKIVGEIFSNGLEHKRAQAIQAGQRQFLELLATGGSLPKVLHSLVRLIEEQWPGMLGLILLLDDDGVHLHYGAAVSLPREYTDSIENLAIGPMVGSCGTASYLGQRVIVEDIATDPRWDGLRDLAVRYSLGACWSQPVFSSEGQVIGTFAMYYRRARAPSDEELRTIETAAHLVGIAIEHDRARQELQRAHDELEDRVKQRTAELQQANAMLQQEIVQRQLAEEALRESETKYRDLVENANSIILQMDARGNITFFNRFAQDFFGYTEGEILGRNVIDTIVPSADTAGRDLRAKLRDVLQHPERYYSSENENARKDGERVWVAWTNKAVHDQDGRLSEVLCIGIDRTEQKRAQEALEQQAKEQAIAAERNRLARDLHDAVSQTLFSTSLIAEVLPRIWERDPEEGHRRLEEVRQLTRGALAEMRTLLLELRPAALIEADLGDLLRQLGEATAGWARVQVDVDVASRCTLPPDVQVAFYRIAQEALNNVAKHATADRATVRLHCDPSHISLQICDDGRGFDVHAVPPDHLGLGIMRERAEAAEIQLQVQSQVGQGTQVTAQWSRK